MHYAVDIDVHAQRDIKEIYDYIFHDLENPIAAIRIADLIAEEIENLSEMPKRYHVWPYEPWGSRGIRSAIVENYHIMYQVDEANATVTVLRVFYGRRNI